MGLKTIIGSFVNSGWKFDPAQGSNSALQIQLCGWYYGAILNSDLVLWIRHSDLDPAKEFLAMASKFFLQSILFGLKELIKNKNWADFASCKLVKGFSRLTRQVYNLLLLLHILDPGGIQTWAFEWVSTWTWPWSKSLCHHDQYCLLFYNWEKIPYLKKSKIIYA